MVDDCCGPMLQQLWAHLIEAQSFAAESISYIEQTHPEITSKMAVSLSAGYDIAEDGTVSANADINLLGTARLSPVITACDPGRL
eukprot:SAG31_NODE_384_length_16414_cov_7.492308_3_plen_85_part_00